MASPLQEQQNLLSFLDAIMACIENYPMFSLKDTKISTDVSVNPIAFLLLLLKKFCSEEEIINWLARYIVYVLPVLETIVKGVILSNLKLGNSCNIDPWIPDEWRQHNDNMHKDADKNADDENTCLIPVSLIDYRNILQINPTSKQGQEYYFNASIEYTHQGDREETTIVGHSYNEVFKQVKALVAETKSLNLPNPYDESNIESTGEIESVYELARADDMNAFLWFAMNKGQYTNINYTNLDNNVTNAVRIATKCQDFNDSYPIDKTPNNTEMYISGDIVSTTKENKNSTNYLICYNGSDAVDKERESVVVEYYSHLCPCSNRANSYNWYVNRKNYFTRNTGLHDAFKKLDHGRNYDEEFPLCNIMCTDKYGNITNNPSINSYLKVLALPRPMLHYQYWQLTKFSNGGADVILPTSFTKILFNADGEKDSKGHFTVQPKIENNKIKTPIYSNKYKMFFYELVDKDGGNTNFNLYCHKNGYEIAKDSGNGTTIYLNEITDENERKKNYEEFINSCLLPCYPGLTIYEFNYDFIMGMRLFEPKTVTYRLIRMLSNFSIGGGLGLGFSIEDAIKTNTITKIIKRIMFSDEVIKDCFFSFSNDEFASMLNDAESKRSQGYTFEETNHNVNINGQEILNTLDQFDDTASLEEQVDVIRNTLFIASKSNLNNNTSRSPKNLRNELTVAKSTDMEGSLTGDFTLDYSIEAIKSLGITILEVLLSPKMLLLFEVNRRIMGNSSEKYPTLEELIKNLAAMMDSIITAIMKKLIADLFEEVMKYLKPILSKLAAMLTLEQLTVYKELILKIIEACTFSFSFPNKYLDTELDVVQYADIDKVDKPIDNEC